MSYEKTWVFTTNQLAFDYSTPQLAGKSFGLQLLDALIAGGWACVSSSNGMVSDTNNNILTLGSIIGAADGNTHSHSVLRSPEGFVLGTSGSGLGEQSRCYLVVSWLDTNYYTGFRMDIHRVLPEGGSITTTPTSPGGIYNVYPVQQVTKNSIAYTPRFHFGVCTTGHFWAAVSYEAYGATFNSGLFPTLILMLPITDPTFVNSLGVGYPYGFAFWGQYNDTVLQHTYSKFHAINAYSGYSYAGVGAVGNISGFIPTMDKGYLIYGDYNNKLVFSPLFLNFCTSGVAGRIGRVPDFYFTQVAVDNPGFRVVGSPQTHVILGGIALPCDTILQA